MALRRPTSLDDRCEREDVGTGPDWLGSPQHFVGGLVVALAVARGARRWVDRWWLVTLLAVGVTATAEVVVELVEYPLLYTDGPYLTAYYDTVADLAATLVGGVVGAGVGLIGSRITSR